MTQTLNALSFDIEDWFHIVEIKAVEQPETWAGLPTIVERRTDEILALMEQHEVRATFFILGWIAERYPTLIRRIAAAGHEIGSHSYWHRKVYELTPDEFRDDMRRSVELLQNLSGKPVEGFRAPSFSITPGTEWAFDVLVELGFRYDASLFPARRAHGGYLCPEAPHRLSQANLAELPMSTYGWGQFKFCYSGGGYFRLLPQWLIENIFRQYQRVGKATVIYLHPRDFATDCPTVPMPIHRRFKCYIGRHTTARKLDSLLRQFPFSTCRDVLDQHGMLD